MTTAPISSARLSLIALAAAALLSACGGGQTDPATAAARDFVGQIERLHPMSASERERAQAITVSQVDAKALFDWVEYKLPTLFPKGPQNVGPLVFDGNSYTIRAYATGNFLGLRSDGAVFALGPLTGGALVQYGRLSDYAAAVVAEQCQVNPANCGPAAELSGPINDCTMPASRALATGNRVVLNYITYTTNPSAPTGESTIESVVDGPSTFEGRSGIRLTSTIRATDTSTPGTFQSTIRSWAQVDVNEHTREIGSEFESTVVGSPIPFSTSAKSVVIAGGLDSEFSLQPGQSFTKQQTFTTTTLTPIPSGPTTDTTSEVITFETRESVAVQAGTFNTCRYRSVSNGNTTVTWYIIGRGIAAKTVSTGGGTTETQELRSGTFNGGPL